MSSTVTLSSRGEQRLRGGHPWIYRTDVVDVSAEPGDIVMVRNAKGRVLGSALFSDRSQITIRMLTYGERQADAALIESRIDAAIAFRESLAIDATAYRLVHGEADLLPSLVIDRYADHLVVQALSQGMDRLLPVAPETPLPVVTVKTAREAVDRVFWYALGRAPSAAERAAAERSAGTPDGLADLLWAVVMKPEFQYVY